VLQIISEKICKFVFKMKALISIISLLNKVLFFLFKA